MAVYRITPPQNPLARVLAAVVGLLVLAGAFMLGLVALAVVAGLGVLAGIAAWVNGWRLRRRAMQAGQGGRPAARDTGVIEAEYTVVTRRREEP